MKVIDAIKKGFEIASKTLAVVLVVFIFNLVWNLVTIPFTPATPLGPAAQTPMSPPLAVLSIIFILLSIFIQGGVLSSMKDAIKEGKAQLDRFAGYGAKFYLRLLGIAVLIGLVIGIAALLATLIAASSAASGNAIIIGITAIIALVVGGLGIYLVVLLSFSPYVLVVKDTGVFETIKASVAFVRKNLLKVVGLGLLLILIGLGIGLIVGVIVGFLSLAIRGRFFQVIVGIISSGVNSYLSIVITASLMSYYLALSKTEQPTQT